MVDTDTPSVWVGCLASYNAGRLHGKWIAAADIREGIAEVLESSPIPGAEEWYIGDYDGGFPNMGEYPSIDAIEAMAEAIDAACDPEAFIAYVGWIGERYATLSGFEDCYKGKYDSLADYAEELYTDCGYLENVPDAIRYHIDWNSIAHDLECNGDYSTVPAPHGMVYIFANH